MQILPVWIYFLAILLVAVFGVVLPERKQANFKKILGFTALFLIVYGVLLYALSLAWYDEILTQNFHWFDDSGEWLLMDKIGHFFTAYWQSRLLVELFKWCGLPKNKAYIFGGFAGAVLLSSVEIMDGYSANYGASVGDLVANVAGSLFLFLQYKLWGKINILGKYSFHQTIFAALRPALLGDTPLTEALKDYNGQTIWFSFSLKRILKFCPNWMMLSVGFGVEGLVGGDDNIFNDSNGKTVDLTRISRSRQFYLSLDVNFEMVKANSRFLKSLLYIVNHFKTPLPAIEFNTVEGVKWHWVYF